MSVNADSKLSQQGSDSTSERSSDEERGAYDVVVRWAPLALPLSAAFIVAGVCFIDWAVFVSPW